MLFVLHTFLSDFLAFRTPMSLHYVMSKGRLRKSFIMLYTTNKHFCLAIDIVNLGIVISVTPHFSSIMDKFFLSFLPWLIAFSFIVCSVSNIEHKHLNLVDYMLLFNDESIRCLSSLMQFLLNSRIVSKMSGNGLMI